MSPRAWAVAGGIVGGVFVLVDGYAAFVRHDGTASHAIRLGFGTDTTAGKVRLCAAWAALTVWVLPHWCIWPADKVRS